MRWDVCGAAVSRGSSVLWADTITCRLTEPSCQLLTMPLSPMVAEAGRAVHLKQSPTFPPFSSSGFTTNMPLTLSLGDGALLEECEQVVDKSRSRSRLPLLQTHLRPTLPILSTDTCVAFGCKWALHWKEKIKRIPSKLPKLSGRAANICDFDSSCGKFEHLSWLIENMSTSISFQSSFSVVR